MGLLNYHPIITAHCMGLLKYHPIITTHCMGLHYYQNSEISQLQDQMRRPNTDQPIYSRAVRSGPGNEPPTPRIWDRNPKLRWDSDWFVS